ncbi:hypothetical protein [Aquisphaera insulae]|uniref:hypothetical protein n=1 Tax=Aquisphaera insulae TaxID=2712864 RepID=UPI0013EDC273|nr:hypothetical protein [Aquisphaera insulae]
MAAVNGNKFLAVPILAGTAGAGTSNAVAMRFSTGDKDNGPDNRGNGDQAKNSAAGDRGIYAFDSAPSLLGTTKVKGNRVSTARNDLFNGK